MRSLQVPRSIMWTHTARFRHKHQTVAGLPMPTAVLYTLLFAVAFWTYTTLWRQAPVITSDSGQYMAVATDLLDLRIDHLHTRTPGYPLLLVLTASREVPTRALFFLSLVLHFASIWVLASVLYTTGLTEKMLTLFGVILLLPPYVEHAAYVMTENLTAFTLAVGFGSLVWWLRHGKALGLGIAALALNYAAFTRPTYQVLALALTGSLWVITVLWGWSPALRQQTLKASLVLLCSSVLLVGGYSYVNYTKFGYFGLSPDMPIALSTRTSRVLERLPEEYAPVREVLIRDRDALLVARGGEHTGYDYLANPDLVRELIDLTGLPRPQVAKYLLHMNLFLIRTAPLNYLYDVACALVSFWLPASTTLANLHSRFMQLLWSGIHFGLMGVFALTLLAFVGGLPHMLTYKRYAARHDGTLTQELTVSQVQSCVYILAGTIVLYTALISSFLHSGLPRFRVPTDGLIVLMAFLGIDVYRRSIRCAKIVAEQRRSHGEREMSG